MIDCALVVVAYDSARDVPQLLGTAADAAGGLSWRAVVVDNAAEAALAGALAPWPEASLVEPGRNLGYSGGLNAGLRAAGPSRFVAFLNPDLTLEPGSLEALVSALADSPDAAAAVPAIRDEHGAVRRSLRREPTILRALGEALFGDRWAGRPAALAEVVRGAGDYCRAHPVDWATGAALLVRREVADAVGEWDAETFFLYSEEVDYCRRIRDRGHSILFVPDAVVRHRESGSGSAPALDALLEVNKVRYYRKWHSAPAAALFALVAVLNSALRPHRAGHRAALAALLSRSARAALPSASSASVQEIPGTAGAQGAS